MKTDKHVLLLIGSPKASKSTSESLSDYLIDQLQTRGLSAEKIHIRKSLRSSEGLSSLLLAVDEADTIILVSPLYVDSLPYPVTRALEAIAEYRHEKEPKKDQSLIGILNCGFPEAHQNGTALAICRLFAKEAGFTWSGGLALGMGGSIDGQALEKLGGMFRNIRASLKLIADAIAESRFVPEEAVKLMAIPLMPKRLYMWAGNFGWRRTAREHGANRRLWDRPYECKM